MRALRLDARSRPGFPWFELGPSPSTSINERCPCYLARLIQTTASPPKPLPLPQASGAASERRSQRAARPAVLQFLPPCLSCAPLRPALHSSLQDKQTEAPWCLSTTPTAVCHTKASPRSQTRVTCIQNHHGVQEEEGEENISAETKQKKREGEGKTKGREGKGR